MHCATQLRSFNGDVLEESSNFVFRKYQEVPPECPVFIPTLQFCVNFQLTGNEDGRCDSENKTIQFNEEVDVVVSLLLEFLLFGVIRQHILLASAILI